MEFRLSKEKLNNFWLGLVVGIVFPFIAYFLIVNPKYKQYQFIGKYYGEMMALLLPMLLSRCIFPNALLFFICIWQDLALTAKGLLYSTLGLTALLFILKFIT